MSHFKYGALLLATVAILTVGSHGRSIERVERDIVTDGVEVDMSVSGENSRAAIPVISDIQRVEKVADLLISIGEHVIPALLDGLAEQVTAVAERKLKPVAEKTSRESMM